MSYADLLLNVLYHIAIEMKIRESCLQTGNFIYKPGISLTKPDFHLQRGSLGLQRGFSGYYLPNVYNEEKLAELYFAETNDYLKIQLFRALFEVNPSREIKEEDVLVKFINESYHIENDYAYYLDMVKFETVPEYIVKAIDDYMERTYSNV